jgi:hypothetical protein
MSYLHTLSNLSRYLSQIAGNAIDGHEEESTGN